MRLVDWGQGSFPSRPTHIVGGLFTQKTFNASRMQIGMGTRDGVGMEEVLTRQDGGGGG